MQVRGNLKRKVTLSILCMSCMKQNVTHEQVIEAYDVYEILSEKDKK